METPSDRSEEDAEAVGLEVLRVAEPSVPFFQNSVLLVPGLMSREECLSLVEQAEDHLASGGLWLSQDVAFRDPKHAEDGGALQRVRIRDLGGRAKTLSEELLHDRILPLLEGPLDAVAEELFGQSTDLGSMDCSFAANEPAVNRYSQGGQHLPQILLLFTCTPAGASPHATPARRRPLFSPPGPSHASAMALSGLEQRLTPLEWSYLPFGPTGLPPFVELLDAAEPLSRATALRALRRSRSYGGYRPWHYAATQQDTSAGAQAGSVSAKSRTCGPRSSSAFTTVMVQNIDTKIRRSALVRFLDSLGLWSHYDYVHFPQVFGTSRNRGFAFVNFVDEKSAQAFLLTPQEALVVPGTNRRPLRLARAEVQGLEANIIEAAKKGRRVRHPRNRPLILTRYACA